MLRQILMLCAVVSAFDAGAFADRGDWKSVSGNAPTGGGAWTSAREFTHAIPAFTETITGPGNNGISRLLTGIPAGTYTSYTVRVEWGNSVNGAWSSEAMWALADGPLATATTFYADPGSAHNSFNTTASRTLNWNGFFTEPYTVPTSGDLHFIMTQAYENSSATWSNVSISIGDAVPGPPDAPRGTLGGSLSHSLGAEQVLWYSFDYGGSGAFSLDTIGSTLSATHQGRLNDTQIGVYGPDGDLVKQNDDIDFVGGNYASRVSFADGEIPAGTYYVALGSYRTFYGSDTWDVKSASIATGTIVLNGLTVPEPSSALVAGLCLLGRRRR